MNKLNISVDDVSLIDIHARLMYAFSLSVLARDLAGHFMSAKSPEAKEFLFLIQNRIIDSIASAAHFPSEVECKTPSGETT